MSATSTVPAAVPSLRKSSLPTAGAVAAKSSRGLPEALHTGAAAVAAAMPQSQLGLLLPLPGKRSMTLEALLLELRSTHNSLPVDREEAAAAAA
jgi:hypothetical protein